MQKWLQMCSLPAASNHKSLNVIDAAPCAAWWCRVCSLDRKTDCQKMSHHISFPNLISLWHMITMNCSVEVESSCLSKMTYSEIYSLESSSRAPGWVVLIVSKPTFMCYTSVELNSNNLCRKTTKNEVWYVQATYKVTHVYKSVHNVHQGKRSCLNRDWLNKARSFWNLPSSALISWKGNTCWSTFKRSTRAHCFILFNAVRHAWQYNMIHPFSVNAYSFSEQ